MYLSLPSSITTESYRSIKVPLSPFSSSVLLVSPQRSFGGPAVHMILADPLVFTPFFSFPFPYWDSVSYLAALRLATMTADKRESLLELLAAEGF